jgi:hypothetical protein
MMLRMRYALTLDGEYVKVLDDRFEHTGMYVVREMR